MFNVVWSFYALRIQFNALCEEALSYTPYSLEKIYLKGRVTKIQIYRYIDSNLQSAASLPTWLQWLGLASLKPGGRNSTKITSMGAEAPVLRPSLWLSQVH